MDFDTYQTRAQLTSQLPLAEAGDALPSLLGLAGEIGSILDVYKRDLRDKTDLKSSVAFFKEELGDVLWYTAAVATACNLRLEDVAADNLGKTANLYPEAGSQIDFSSSPVLDEAYPAEERFPRRLVIEFTESGDSPPRAIMRIVNTDPNVFPNGPVEIGGKVRGFAVGGTLGAPLTDNARVPDDYRYHDAIHLGFLAILGWSPTLRALLQLKRRSNPGTDDADDGARAIFAEEGLSAVLAHLAHDRHEFSKETNVDGSTLMVVRAATAGLEVSKLPLWLWRRAINQGFTVMHSLAANAGGTVTADLDTRSLIYVRSAK